MGAVVASLAGSALGGLAGKAMDGGGSNSDPVSDTVTSMNNLLSKALNGAIGQSTNYTNQAIGQQNQSLNTATSDLQNYLNSATSQATQYANQGTSAYQALQSPYAQSGYAANDALMDSLGLSRAQMGGGALAANLSQANNTQNQIAALQSQYGSGPIAAPTAPTMQSILSGITPQQEQNYINANTSRVGNQTNNVQFNGVQAQNVGQLYQRQDLMQAAAQALAQQQYQQQNQQYQQQNQQYQNYTNALGQINYNPQAQQIATAYQNGLFK